MASSTDIQEATQALFCALADFAGAGVVAPTRQGDTKQRLVWCPGGAWCGCAHRPDRAQRLAGLDRPGPSFGAQHHRWTGRICPKCGQFVEKSRV